MKDLRYEHQSIKVGGWWCGWRVVGWGVYGWEVVGWVVVAFMGRVGVVVCMVGCLEGSWGGCIYSPTHEQLQCQNISSYEHPPTHQTYPKCYSVTIHVLWMVHGVGGGWWSGGWRVHGWVVMDCMVGWVVGEFMGWVHILTHP